MANVLASSAPVNFCAVLIMTLGTEHLRRRSRTIEFGFVADSCASPDASEPLGDA